MKGFKMTLFAIIHRPSIAASFAVVASSAQAQTATMDTPENIAAVMEACLVIITAHDYESVGQGVELPWKQVSSRVSSFSPIGDAAKVSAYVSSSAGFSNSYCDIFFDDPEMAKTTFDLFMSERDQITFEGRNGLCVDGEFVQAEIPESDDASAAIVNARGHITMHNDPSSGELPCAE